MQPRQRTLKAIALLVGALSLILSSASFAGAGVPEHAAARGHSNAGDADQRSAEITEDDDDNDGGTPNNVVDDGDNEHPSGKDRSVEPGRSGNQGNAQSDPDDDGRGPDRSNGGVDQPGGEGGVDQADQDGNNGCGNDDDFEDDNEGLCRGRDGAPGQQDDEGLRCPAGMTEPEGEELVDGSDDDELADNCVAAEGEVVNNPTTPDETSIPPTEVENEAVVNNPTILPVTQPNLAPALVDRTPAVMGDVVTRSVRSGQLPRTGDDAAASLAPFGVALLLAGLAIQRSSRRIGARR
ncbi:MAG: hypothetical protein ACLGIC_12680 [Acidimicrobiia bacterium]